MQYHQEIIRYGDNPHNNAHKRVGYLSPMKICEDEHMFRIGPSHDAFKGKTPAVVETIMKEMKKNFEVKYASYPRTLHASLAR
jgi:hypothetical protein